MKYMSFNFSFYDCPDFDPLTRKLCYVKEELSTNIFDDKTCLEGYAPLGEPTNFYLEEVWNVFHNKYW